MLILIYNFILYILQFILDLSHYEQSVLASTNNGTSASTSFTNYPHAFVFTSFSS